MSETPAQHSDLVARIERIENSQVAIIHNLDEMRAENNARFSRIEQSLAALLESNRLLAELIVSRLPPQQPKAGEQQ